MSMSGHRMESQSSLENILKSALNSCKITLGNETGYVGAKNITKKWLRVKPGL